MTDADAARLPKRSAAELAEALRVRAGCLSGQAWEAPATAAMMLEAAEWLAAIAAMPRQVQARKAPIPAPRYDDVFYKGTAMLNALPGPQNWERCSNPRCQLDGTCQDENDCLALAALPRQETRKAPTPAPRYDDVFYQGVAALDASAHDPNEFPSAPQLDAVVPEATAEVVGFADGEPERE